MTAMIKGVKNNGEEFGYTLDNVVSVNIAEEQIVIIKKDMDGQLKTYTYNEKATGYKYTMCFM